ncbi:MAG: LysM peptidoglycan-binding domain-containing protein [Deltaproteobacteria bacterium]|nr:LysM peptidoglycan-binding domain-containing protein [Deltaproteobacteria bacterium]
MDQHQDMEEEEFLEDEEEDTEGFEPARSDRRRPDSHGLSPQGRTLIFAVAGAVILIAFIVIFFGGRDKGASEELKALPARMDGMEKRLIQAELAGPKIGEIENELKGMKQSVQRIEGGVKSLERELDALNQKLAALSRTMVSVPQQAQAAPPMPKKAPAEAGARSHRVQRGDTLYSISKTYGTTVDAIRRLNNIGPKDAIRPGQELRIP